MTKGELILIEAEKLLGVKWAHMGRSAHELDCIGLVVLSAINAGVAPPDYRTIEYGRSPKISDLLRQSGGYFNRKFSSPELGDVIVFSTSTFIHMGIFAGGSNIIHAYATVRAVVRSSMERLPSAKSRIILGWI